MRGHPLVAVVSVALLLAVAAVAAACDGDDESPTPAGTPIAHAAGQRDLLLRYQVGGGLLPSPPPADLPDVSLFGDGMLVLANERGATRVDLTEAGIQRLLRLVVDAGVLAEPSFPPSSGCADCPTTVIGATIDGRTASVSVYALAIATPEGEYDEAAYRSVEGFARFLDALDVSTFQPSELRGSGPYTPPGYHLQAFPFEAFPPPDSIPAWPAELPSLGSLFEGGVVCGAAARLFEALPNDPLQPFQDGGETAIVRSRLLLPDDPGADACTW